MRMLKPGVDSAAFERHMTEIYGPRILQKIPGLRGYLVHGDRGRRKGQYVPVWEFGSMHTPGLYPASRP